MDDRKLTPREVRKLIREEKITGQTSGLCPGYAQANLLILPKDQAYDFLLFTQRNPRACPILEVTDMGSRQLHYLAQDADVARDFPKYRIYRKGKMIGEYTSIDRFWQDNFVSFLIGCSFSFEAGLLEADVPVRQIVLNVFDKIEQAAQTKGSITGLETGFAKLDKQLSGLQPSDLILIAARPSVGKTAFVLNLTETIAVKHNIPVWKCQANSL